MSEQPIIVAPADERVLDALGPGLAQRAGPLLRPLVAALVDVVRGIDEDVTEGVLRTGPGDLAGTRSGGISDLFNLDRSPYPGWLGQWVGVPFLRSTTRAQQIAAVRSQGTIRGGPDAVIAAARGAMNNLNARVDLLERFGSAYRFVVRTYARQNTNPAAVEAAVLAAKPGGVLVEFEVAPGQTWSDLAARRLTYSQLGAFTHEQIRVAVPGQPMTDGGSV